MIRSFRLLMLYIVPRGRSARPGVVVTVTTPHPTARLLCQQFKNEVEEQIVATLRDQDPTFGKPLTVRMTDNLPSAPKTIKHVTMTRSLLCEPIASGSKWALDVSRYAYVTDLEHLQRLFPNMTSIHIELEIMWTPGPWNEEERAATTRSHLSRISTLSDATRLALRPLTDEDLVQSLQVTIRDWGERREVAPWTRETEGKDYFTCPWMCWDQTGGWQEKSLVSAEGGE